MRIYVSPTARGAVAGAAAIVSVTLMYAPNAQLILSRLSERDVVLDVGGWACPFNRANIVIDAEPYETRGYYTHQERAKLIFDKTKSALCVLYRSGVRPYRTMQKKISDHQ